MPGTKRLFILRHAKSSWEDPGLDDHERPLAPRGVRGLAVMSEHIRAAGIRPDLVLCSSARRTRETLEGIAVAGEHVIEPDLYSASTADVLERLLRVPEGTGSVMLVGHNPTVQMLVLRLAAHGSTDGGGSKRAAVQRKFPTGSLATLEFEGAWGELVAGCARLVEFVTPKELNSASGAGGGAQAPPASTTAH
jgi:phosphohistidine phosphatase